MNLEHCPYLRYNPNTNHKHKSVPMPTPINPDVLAYNHHQTPINQDICQVLATHISQQLPQAEHKLWHAHPVWFINGNPIVGYSKQKDGIRLMFWSGADFNEPHLQPSKGKYKDASIFYTTTADINLTNLHRWLHTAQHIQWDYKNIVKRKGQLIKLE